MSIDYKKTVEYKNDIVLKLRKGLELTLKKAGVYVIKEHAKLVDKNLIKTENNEYSCKKVIIATGSRPKEIKGLEYEADNLSDHIRTSSSIFLSKDRLKTSSKS